jgi:hypothetical protein
MAGRRGAGATDIVGTGEGLGCGIPRVGTEDFIVLRSYQQQFIQILADGLDRRFFPAEASLESALPKAQRIHLGIAQAPRLKLVGGPG